MAINAKDFRSGTKIIQCSCSHEYQDQKYGKQMRVHNFCSKGKESRCTICSKVKSTGG